MHIYVKLVGGRCVKLDLTREEDFVNTRVRTAMKIKIKSYVRPNGRFVARKIEIYGNKGAYASHGHSMVNKAGHAFKQIYNDEVATKGDMYSVFTNMPTSGAMRGYGIPQLTFALESHVDDIAKGLGVDRIEIRKLNAMKLGFVDNQVKCNSNGLLNVLKKVENTLIGIINLKNMKTKQGLSDKVLAWQYLVMQQVFIQFPWKQQLVELYLIKMDLFKFKWVPQR